MSKIGILGSDAGTQGLSIVFVDESVKVVATGDGAYEMVLRSCEFPGLRVNRLRRG